MAKKNEMPPMIENIVKTPMEDVMHQSMIPYAEHVIMERAVPRVEDGLKPVQRRILYTMTELSLDPEKPHRKCARIVGDCLGKYHPHGDTSVYDALVRLAQPFSMRGQLVDGHGNFGSIDGDTAAAMRYTEARMAPLALEMLRDIEKDTVPFRLNFDDTLKEPDMLPARYPNLLVNGASGIAVGLATNIPPHNLREAIAAVTAQIENPDITLDELMKHIPAPDFPTGGVLLDTEEIKNAYATGRGKLQLRARVHIEDGSAGRKLIVITEVPYMVNKAAMLEKILHLSEEKKTVLGCIYDIRDESDRTGLRAVIELRRDADVDSVLACLYKYSEMQVTFGVNMVAIADAKPRLLPLKEIIRYFIKHQENVVSARTRYDLDHAKARAHILEGLMIAVDNLDEVIKLIRASKSAKEAKLALMEAFSLSEAQAQAILDLRLQRLTGLEVLALRKEYEELKKLIAELEAILASEKKLLNVIKKELRGIAEKYGDDRRTTLEDPGNVIEASNVMETVAEEAVVTFSREGYLRRMLPAKFRRIAPQGFEETGDEPVYRFTTDTDATLSFFTNLGNCYQLSVGALPEMHRPKDRGALLTGVLAGLETGEAPVYLLCCKSEELDAMPDLLFVTEQGMVKRSAAKEYNVKRQKFAAINLKGSDRLLSVLPIQLDSDLLLISKRGMSIRFHADEIPAMGRVTAGVKGMQLDIGDTVLWLSQPQPTDQVLVLSDRGFGKRIPYMDFEPQARNGKGVKAMYFNKNGSNGTQIAAALLISTGVGSVTVTQKRSEPTTLDIGEIIVQGKQDKGMPYLMAILDDVVTGASLKAIDQQPIAESNEPESDLGDGDNPQDEDGEE